MYLNKNIACTILGLDASVYHTQYDIKFAFKKIALKVHPDKTAKNDTREFMKAKLAYDYLKGCTEKGRINPDCDFNNINYYEILQKLFKVFGSAIATAASDNIFYDNEEDDIFYDANDDEEHHQQQSYDIHLKVDVSLNELHSELGKRMKIKYNDENGSTSTRIVIVSFVDYEHKYVYSGYGDWDPKNVRFGDLIMVLSVRDHPDYIINTYIDKHDLIRCFDISVSDYYFGFTKEFDHFGETLTIEHTPYVDGSEKVMYGTGLQSKGKRGDLYIIFKLNMHALRIDRVESVSDMTELKNYFPSLI
jgi:DnaJ-class molecular chaperone